MSSNSVDIENQRTRIDRLFLKFAVFYGHVWRSQFKEDKFREFAKREWREALERFENDVIDKAIRQCRDGDDYPPTLPQFISYCRQARVKFVRASSETVSVIANPEVFKHHMKVIKGILHNNWEKHNASPNT